MPTPMPLPSPPAEADIAWWLPRLRAAAMLTPDTVLVPLPGGVVPPADAPTPAYLRFVAAVAAAAERVGYPCVLRTPWGLPKHQWASACRLDRPADIDARVRAQAAWAAENHLPLHGLAVRQLIPLVGYFTVYDGLPLAREFRAFLRDGEPLCLHPAWPYRAVAQGKPNRGDWVPGYVGATTLAAGERRVLLALAAVAGQTLPGEWAVDLAAVRDGRWAVIDAEPMAGAWHWPDCPHHPAAVGPRPAAIPADEYSVDPDDPDLLPAACLAALSLDNDEPPASEPEPELVTPTDRHD